jgi:hypothetical protein
MHGEDHGWEKTVGWEKTAGAHVTWAHVDTTLQATRTIWLATAGADEGHAVPVWFLWDGRDVVFATPLATRKARNIADRPGVSLHLGDGDEVVIIEGQARQVRDSVALVRLADDYASKYVEPHVGVGARLIAGDEDIVYSVRPRRILAWSYGDVTTRTEWRPTR